MSDFSTIWSTDSKFLWVGAAYDTNLVYCKFSDTPNVLACLDVTDGTIKWQKEIANPDGETGERYKRIQKILGLYKDKLYIVNYAGRILELQAGDGEMTAYWFELPDGISWHDFDARPVRPQTCLPATRNSILVPDEGKIYGLSDYFFWEIDLEIKAVSFFDQTEEFRASRVKVQQTGQLSRQGDCLFFTSRMLWKNEQNTWDTFYKIAAFNTKTRKLEWTHPFEFTGINSFASPAPIVEEDRLYVMDTEGLLYVFGKEPETAA